MYIIIEMFKSDPSLKLMRKWYLCISSKTEFYTYDINKCNKQLTHGHLIYWLDFK